MNPMQEKCIHLYIRTMPRRKRKEVFVCVTAQNLSQNAHFPPRRKRPGVYICFVAWEQENLIIFRSRLKREGIYICVAISTVSPQKTTSCGTSVEQFVGFFIKVEQILVTESAFWVYRRPITANSRILFDYTDKPSELCPRKH